MSGAAHVPGACAKGGAPGVAGPEAAREVIDWYRHHARDLPWRRPGTSPYAVLVCEVMSQQTPVERVLPAWREWMSRWPDPAALAAADAGEVLRVWGRLGYPRRALRLMETARVVVEQHDGVLPQEAASLLALPGVGPYTAGAVLAFALGRRALALDTNVRRVLARAHTGTALAPPTLTRAETTRAGALQPGSDAEGSAWSAAVMELGALVCTARAPRCEQCPWRERCAWLAAGRPADEHAGRRRTQTWHGTDRQARGLVMARLREAPPGAVVGREALLEAAALAGARASRAGQASEPDRDQPGRALAGLLADGLVVSEDGGHTFRLP
ncbi:A/G-specific adenine glycosylase [Actinomyces sp. W5033]|uniref:A/G-specific adenine glycosylase n=1 Tax=Actinomyces sp. W5033 TaxID=3446479 RepID=UPI003EE153D8